MEITSLLSHWLMQFTERNIQERPGFAAKKYAMKNTGGIYVLT